MALYLILNWTLWDSSKPCQHLHSESVAFFVFYEVFVFMKGWKAGLYFSPDWVSVVYSLFLYFFVFSFWGIKSRASYMLGKHSTIELHPSPGVVYSWLSQFSWFWDAKLINIYDMWKIMVSTKMHSIHKDWRRMRSKVNCSGQAWWVMPVIPLIWEAG
jgi:hypothetical protein